MVDSVCTSGVWTELVSGLVATGSLVSVGFVPVGAALGAGVWVEVAGGGVVEVVGAVDGGIAAPDAEVEVALGAVPAAARGAAVVVGEDVVGVVEPLVEARVGAGVPEVEAVEAGTGAAGVPEVVATDFLASDMAGGEAAFATPPPRAARALGPKENPLPPLSRLMVTRTRARAPVKTRGLVKLLGRDAFSALAVSFTAFLVAASMAL